MQTITCDDFVRMFDCTQEELPEEVVSGLSQINTAHRDANTHEFKEYILYVLKLMDSPGIFRTTEQNYQAWERGWREHLDCAHSGNLLPQVLKPKYFRPSKFLRYNRKLAVIENPDLEYDLFTVARYLLFRKYLSGSKNIYELGCGSCQNLLMLSELFPSKRLYGLDWSEASVKIAGFLKKQVNKNIEGLVFDMIKPPLDIVVTPNSAIITIHSLEQLGCQHEKLLSFIMAARPDIVLHYEPILEFYDQDNLLDYLALFYSQKRNYLSGFWPALCKLREQNKIEIIKARRPYLGGVVHETSLIVWKPLK